MFSKSCKYAIRAVLFLAINSDEEKKMRVEQLATELGVPKPFLAKILQQLTKAKMVSSTKGRNGGFYLNQKNKSSNLLSVIDSFDGKGAFTNCVIGLDNCSNDKPCPYHDSVQQYRISFYAQLKNETIEASAKRIDDLDLKLRNEINK